MLEELRNCTANIGHIPQNRARQLYAAAMTVALAVGDALDDLMTPDGLLERPHRMLNIAIAAQELAYAYVLHYGEPIASGSIRPERFNYTLTPPGTPRTTLGGVELQREIMRFLQQAYPNTIPPEMREY